MCKVFMNETGNSQNDDSMNKECNICDILTFTYVVWELVELFK